MNDATLLHPTVFSECTQIDSPRTVRYFLDVVQILGAGREYADSALSRLNGVQCLVVLVAIFEDEPTAGKVFPEIAQIQQRCVVKRSVRFLVHMRMPIFVVHGFRCHIGNAREKRRMRQIQ